MWRFTAPTLVFGADAVQHLRKLEGEKAFLVTDSTIRDLGLDEPVIRELEEAAFDIKIFDRVTPNPTLEMVKEGARHLEKWKPDVIVALGGGSSMDTAKGMWMRYERPDLSLYDITPYAELGVGGKARLVAVPTTSGTGAEVSWAAALTDGGSGKKIILASKEIVPDIAIIDPAFPAVMPPSLTADTGLDALTHAVEAYVSTWRNDFSDGLAVASLRLIFQYLPDAFHQGADVAREKMHYAASMAGMAMGNSNVGLAHSLGHTLGVRFAVPHGRAVGMFLPYVMQYNRRAEEKRYAEVAHRLGVQGERHEAVDRLLEDIWALLRELHEPTSLKETGIKASAFHGQLDGMVRHAQADPSTIGNPRRPTTAEVKKLLMHAWEGKDVDF